MATEPKILDLPDYPAIRKLASALHRLDSHQHGAAIMVGAGFSRSAAHHVGDSKKMPLWGNFTQKLARDLYPDDANLNFADPLRVAEEFRTYFGTGALNDRIRSEIDDQAWRTGPLYKSLLSLPWTDVLTTNWDTLLERAADSVHGPYYTVVTKASDLAWAQSPRIVKLHGTIGITDTLIAAQEDYRTYPERFAPFVNMARQVFIENELCLLGFSGDDPNFLQWAGWVRDHLANHARKIYLAGALNLSPARRKYLESINVAPIDLYPTVAYLEDRDLQHHEATRLFLQAMRDAEKSKPKPHEWYPTSLVRTNSSAEDHAKLHRDPEYGAQALTEQIPILQQDRMSYPNWVVCPPSLRSAIANQVSTPFPNPQNIAALTPDNRSALLYELAWRQAIAHFHIRPWLVDALFSLVYPSPSNAITKRQQGDIALWLLNNSRWDTTESEERKRAIKTRSAALIKVIEDNAIYIQDANAEIAYHRALIARDSLDYIKLTEMIPRIAGKDPVWKLRKMAMLAELGRSAEAIDLIASAYGDLREQHRRNQQSIQIMSRLLWARWLLDAVSDGNDDQGIEDLPSFVESNFRKWKCDPWSWLDSFRRDVDQRREAYDRQQNPIEPQFQQGHYLDHSEDGANNSPDSSDFLFLDGLTRVCGIPLRLRARGFNVSLFVQATTNLLLHGGTGDDLIDLALTVRSSVSNDSEAIKDGLGRIRVACLEPHAVEASVRQLTSAIKYWHQECRQASDEARDHRLSRLRVLLEVLGRLVVRVSSTEAKDLFRLATEMGHDPELQDHWLSKSLESLLVNSMTSIPSSEQGELLLDALKFPLPQEIKAGTTWLWPNPVIEHPGTRERSSVLDERVAGLIRAVREANGTEKSASLLRLLPLSATDSFLTAGESVDLFHAIWGGYQNYEELPETGLYPHTLAVLPAGDRPRVEKLIRSCLYDHGPEILDNTQKDLRVLPSPEIRAAMWTYNGMAAAASSDKTRLYPDANQALALFDRLTSWRPVTVAENISDMVANARHSLALSIGRALSYAIVPSLSSEAKTSGRFEQLHGLYSDVDGAMTALPALASFAEIDSSTASAVARDIAIALRGGNPTLVSQAAIAIHRWMKLPDNSQSTEFKRLVTLVIGIIESGRMMELQQLLWLSGELLTAGRFSDEQQQTLREVIPEIYKSTDYVNIIRRSRQAVVASTVRVVCVKLASTLAAMFPDDEALRGLIADSKTDALPEVRFAAADKALVVD
ncbi:MULTISPECIES: SIR2 family protein [unclassified Burkholderia]|uniref:SIR2 family NAD-dependent protein deacylase n=1 Tax=unclassified Burkholderia TaxID=2613784 RepID=UPI002AB202EC|nr:MULTISPECIES: SIR2 family protein [unclassified Burkholderia]